MLGQALQLWKQSPTVPAAVGLLVLGRRRQRASIAHVLAFLPVSSGAAGRRSPPGGPTAERGGSSRNLGA